MALCIRAKRVARNDHDLVGEGVGKVVQDALQHGEPQRQDDGIRASQRVVIVRDGDRSSTHLCGQLSRRPTVCAREAQ